MKKLLLPLTAIFLTTAILAGCNGQQQSVAPMMPMTAPQAHTEPEEQYANPGSLFSEASADALYADNRAHRVGDIVLIKIVENAKSKSKAETTANRATTRELGFEAFFGKSSIGLGGLKAGVGADPFLSATSTSDLTGTGETLRENYVTATIGARIIQVLPGNLLQLQGAREVRVNDETQYMVVSGIVRSKDVASDNSVQSTQMADSRVEYYGKGVLADKNRAGWLTRLLDNVWPF